MRALIVENGVVINATKVDDAAFAEVQGWIVSDAGQIGDLWDGETFLPAPTSPPTPEDVTAEWQRRVDAGGSFKVPGIADDIPVPGRQPYREVIQAKFSAAQLFKAQGIDDPVVRFWDGENVEHMLTPDQMLSLCLQSMQFYEALSATYHNMKHGKGDFLDGIPDDFTDERHWLAAS